MSLSATINAARSALNVSALGIQISGNNMANVATPGYSRQIAVLKALQGSTYGKFQTGGGVAVADVQRKVDEALVRRLRAGISDEHAAASKVATFSQLESVLNELTGFDLSTSLNDFFSVWSEATSLTDSGSVVVEQGAKLANSIHDLRSEMTLLRRQVEDQIDQNTKAANSILNEIAGINAAISASEIGQSKANALRDQRDQLVAELSTLVDVNTVEDGQGSLDVLIGSTPVIIGSTNRGLSIQRETNDEGVLEVGVVIAKDNTPVSVTGGAIGGLIESRDGTIDTAIDNLDELAAQLIFEVNKLHSTGTVHGTDPDRYGYSSSRSSLQVPTADRSLALNDPNNTTMSNLPFAAENGGFYVNVHNSVSGATETVWVEVDLDGLDNTGAVGFGDDTSAEDIRPAIDGIDGLRATWTTDGQLQIEGETGYSFSFSEDSSSVLAVLGVNSYFEGTSAQNIAVRPELKTSPSLLGLGRFEGGTFVENGTSLGIAKLQDQALTSMGNRTVSQFWGDAVQRVAVTASTAYNEANSTALVRESLESQRSAMSGVSLDEESINLITYQQQYQGARLIQIADEMTQELLNII